MVGLMWVTSQRHVRATLTREDDRVMTRTGQERSENELCRIEKIDAFRF